MDTLCWLLLTCVTVVSMVAGFPQGAPAEACESLRPRHWGTEPHDPQDSPFHFIASDDFYNYNSEGIHVQLSGARFKGFLIAALDPETHERIGTWYPVKGTVQLPCSAISHADPYPKKKVILLWHPPKDRKQGNVIFVATVLENYANYFTGIIAKVEEQD